MLHWIKDVLSSWLGSLKVLTPTHGKLFLLVTLKTIYETYKVLFKKFWWLFLVCVGVDIIYKNYVFSSLIHQVIGIIWFLMWCLLAFVTFLTIRPSISLKNYSYYLDHYRYFLPLILYVYLARSLWLFIFIGLHNTLLFIPTIIVAALTFMVFSPVLIPTIFVSPFLMVLVFFLLDSRIDSLLNIVKALFRALKMVFYNYPFFIIMAIITLYGWLFTRDIMITILMWFSKISGVISVNSMHSMADDLAKLILPIFICFVSNFYIKQVHEEFKRYF